MGLFDNKVELRQLEIIEDLQRRLFHCLNHKCHCHKADPVRLVLTISIKNTKFILMALELAANQFAIAALSLIDSVTLAPVADATFSATTAVSDNEAVVKAEVLPDGTVKATAIAAGTANITVTSVAAFTNSLGVASTGSVSTVVPVTIDAVATADGVTLVVTFGTPQAQ